MCSRVPGWLAICTGIAVVWGSCAPSKAAEIDEAFAPLAVRAGSFELLPSLELRAGYTDNAVRAGSDRQSSALSALAAAIDARSDWSRHEVRLALRGEYTAFAADSGFDDASLSVEPALRLDLAHADEFRLSAVYRLDRENRVNDRALASDTSYLHRINRLSVRLSTGVSDFAFGRRGASLGSAARDDVADYVELRGGLRLAYELRGETELFVDGSANRRRFDDAIGSDGQRQGSDGFGLLAGVGFNGGAKLRGAAALGYRVQRPDEDALQRIDALVFNSDLVWDATALTTLALSLGSDIGETTLAGASGFVSRRLGLGLTHALRRNVLLNADLIYERNDFDGIDMIEQTIEARLGVEYRLNRNLALTSSLAHLDFDSSAAGANYRATTLMLGVKAQP